MSVRLHATSLRLTVFFAGIIVLETSGFATDIPEMLGGGNISLDRDPSKVEAKLQVLQSLGAGMCRICSAPTARPAPCGNTVAVARQTTDRHEIL